RSHLMHHHKNHRGFMFNNQSRSYLTNNDLIAGLDYIKTHLLADKNIDILVFDTCMGAMIEVGYQVAPYVDFMVGCQSCALVDGFEYKGIMELLKSSHNAPRDVARGMIQVFDAYYTIHDERGIYTNSAFDLRMIIAYCAGFDVRYVVHGSAIYCLFSHIESSYYETSFAQSSQWMKLLQHMCHESEGTIAAEWTVG